MDRAVMAHEPWVMGSSMGSSNVTVNAQLVEGKLMPPADRQDGQGSERHFRES